MSVGLIVLVVWFVVRGVVGGLVWLVCMVCMSTVKLVGGVVDFP